MKITVLGAGSWGLTLGKLLFNNGHQVTVWGRNQDKLDEIKQKGECAEYLPGIPIPPDLTLTSVIEEAAAADMLVSSVSSQSTRSVISLFAPHISSGAIIVNTSKGLEENSSKFLTEVISEAAPGRRIALLSGPSHAEEVSAGQPTTCVSAAHDEQTAKIVQDVFMSPVFRVYTNSDLIGVELGGVLKNIIALAAGITDGLGYGDNIKAALMTRGMAEIARLGVAMGAKLLTFSGLSGIGDLIVTCTSMHSRNRRAGILLGQGKTLEETLTEVHMTVEGVKTTRAAYSLAKKYNVSMPITKQIYAVLFEGKSPQQAVLDLMTRDKTFESVDHF